MHTIVIAVILLAAFALLTYVMHRFVFVRLLPAYTEVSKRSLLT